MNTDRRLKMRYNIALYALDPESYCNVANELFSDMSQGYILSENSHPHITLCQFKSDDLNVIEAIWEQVKIFNFEVLEPKFLGINFQKGAGEHHKFYWVQITVERENPIMDMHLKVLNILNENQMKCITDNSDLYKPHVTLARIQLNRPISVWPSHILNPTAFKITLGISDENGQYLKMMYDQSL